MMNLEVIMASFKVLYHNLSWGTEEKKISG